MRRKLVIIITTILILTTLVTSSLAATSSTAIDDVAVRLVTDPNTSSPPTSSDTDGFGSSGADGRVWTDKSVTVNDKNFDVVLSALSQEYISTSSGAGGAGAAADVIFVLDMSSSMTTGTDGRIQKMVNATNKAIDIIMNANSANRIGVYYFNTQANALMSMASYISPNTGKANPNNRYISYSGSGSSISVVAGLTKTTINGTTSTTTATSASTAAATHTQYGLYTGINALITDMAGLQQSNMDKGFRMYCFLLTGRRTAPIQIGIVT